MNAPVKTYKQLAPPSIALAKMAWKRAKALHGGLGYAGPPLRNCCAVCEAYFEILERISAGEQP